MRCRSCSHENREGAAYCGACGEPVTAATTCPTCGAAGSPGQTYCDGCGHPARAEAAASLPKTFCGGRYDVRRFLGEGAKKQVYLAHDTRLDRDVAFALLKTRQLTNTATARLRAEAQAMGRLGDHPHIVTIYDVGDEGGRPFIVSQHMAGGDLQEALSETADGRLPIDEALRIGEELAAALEHAHASGIVHRDLKPANVWLSPKGEAKLGDFGVALAEGRYRYTAETTIVGTAEYLSPEQALGDPTDARTDLYALGAVLYEMLTGRPPFIGESTAAIVSQHLNATPAPPSSLRPEVPAALDSLILHLLAKAPDRRPETAAIVREALHAIRSGAEGTREGDPRAGTLERERFAVVRSSAIPSAPTRRGTRRPRTWHLAAVAAVAVTAAIWSLQHRDTPRNTPLPGHPPGPLVVGVMDFDARGAKGDVDWMCQSTRDSLNTILSKVDGLRVYAKEKIDFIRESGGLREIEVAEELGITKMIKGTLVFSNTDLTLEVHVVDIATGFLVASIPRRRSMDDLIQLQNDIAVELLQALEVSISPARLRDLTAHRTNETMHDYNLLYDTLDDFEDQEGETTSDAAAPHVLGWPILWPQLAHAQDADDPGARGDQADHEHIHALLDRYRAALEAEDVQQMEDLHVSLSGRQRAAFDRYFNHVSDLHVQISDVDVMVEGDKALATFTREDVFKDARSGRAVRLEVRMSSLLSKTEGTWKIRGLRKPL